MSSEVATTIRVYNTLSRSKEPLETVQPGKVGMYLCGPTVYKEAHIGHMVGPVIFDCVKRYLSYCGYDVTWVVNITDVDDKLIAESTRRGITMEAVATEMTADYISNLTAMGVDQIDHMPKATEHMTHICDFISQLIDKGCAYESEGDVYFEVSKDEDYGKLSNRTADSQQGEGGEMASRKRSNSDFALWKSSKPGEPSWESPWGQGRPGWHIECSAMSRALLGETFDIHGGGLDLMFPHHENEIAQSECCHGAPMARYWMHNGLMRAGTKGKVGGRNDREAASDGNDGSESVEEASAGKISRSKGAGGLADLIAANTGERIRFFLLRTHYRSTIVFDDDGLKEAGTAIETFRRFFQRFERITDQSFYDLEAAPNRVAGDAAAAGDHPLIQAAIERRTSFLEKMDDDFNTGAAMSDLFELVRALNKHVDSAGLEEADSREAAEVEALVAGAKFLKEFSNILGLFQAAPATGGGADEELVGNLMNLLIQIRNDSRANKDFATADRVRDDLTALNVTLEDRSGETDWNRDSGVTADGLMQTLIRIRQDARENKDFAMSDRVRDELAAIGVTLEDRKGDTGWTRS